MKTDLLPDFSNTARRLSFSTTLFKVFSFFCAGFALALAGLWVTGCSSAPPATLPPARLQAGVMARAASKLSSAENWPAAARQWSVTAERFAALNDTVSQAAALHNLAQAQREMFQTSAAQSNLLMAATLNIETGQTNAWWRNQIALIQLGQDDTNLVSPASLKQHFNQLEGRAVSLTDSEIKGLFYNEQGYWLLQQGELSHASNVFQRAKLAFMAIHDESGLAAVAENSARLYLIQSNWTAAFQAWNKALATYEALGDLNGIARCLEGQGETFLKQGSDLNSAEKQLRRAASNFAVLRRPCGQCRALENLVVCLAKLNKSVIAEQSALASAHQSCATLQESAGNLSKARQHWMAAMQLWQTVNQTEAAAKAKAAMQRCSQSAL